ncbi:cysteine proteinase [Amylostereum chailletii]|nr:cysteine proteinase [Amylostereum chailletii]
MMDLREAARQDEVRRRSAGDEPSREFLERAFQRVRATLDSPKPPPVWTPSLEQLTVSRRKLDDDIEQRIRPKLPDTLPPEDEADVDNLFSKRGTIAKFAREQVTDRDIARLRPNQWLNDEIINFYGQLLLARSEAAVQAATKTRALNGINGVNRNTKKSKPLDVHYFSTFFWSKLTGEGYEKGRLSRWTKRFDIFSKDVLLIPVNHNNMHWTGAAVNFRRKRIESYDSMGSKNKHVFQVIRSYLNDEHKSKKKTPFDFTDWVDYTLPDTPQQENGYDCGVFTCQFLETLSRGEETFNFTQKNIKYLRRRMVWEIAHTQLRDEH